MKPNPILHMDTIHVAYGDKQVLRGVNFELLPGEIHALIGPHRAGKSTLVKLLSGAVRKTGGTIMLNGTSHQFFTPKTAVKHGIGTVYQELTIIPTLSAIENIFIGQKIKIGAYAKHYEQATHRANTILEKLNLQLNLHTPLKNLSRAEQHIVEVVRTLYFDPRIIILDEIANKFTVEEMDTIYPVLQDCKNRGTSIIYISHNLDEIFEFSDRVTILKEGLSIGTEHTRDLDRIKVINQTYSYIPEREKLKRESEKLYYFKKYNENIIKNIPIGVVIINGEQHIYLANYSAVTILDLPGTGITGEPVTDIIERFPIQLHERLYTALAEKERLYFDDITVKNKLLKVIMFPFRDDYHRFLGTIILIEDITREQYFKDNLVRLEKISSIAELAAGVAHEINNPLGIIKNYLELIKLKTHEPDKLEKVQKIDNEIDRISKIVGSLLSFSRLNDIHSSRLNIIDIIDDTVVLLTHKFKKKQIRVERIMEDTVLPMAGEENRLKQLFMNLIINSVEAVDTEGLITIRARNVPRKKSLEITIEDNGCGIPADIRNTIFSPFFTTKTGKKNAGLGLSICQHVVELHKGIISCDSEPGRTRFTIRFPRG